MKSYKAKKCPVAVLSLFKAAIIVNVEFRCPVLVANLFVKIRRPPLKKVIGGEGKEFWILTFCPPLYTLLFLELNPAYIS